MQFWSHEHEQNKVQPVLFHAKNLIRQHCSDSITLAYFIILDAWLGLASAIKMIEHIYGCKGVKNSPLDFS